MSADDLLASPQAFNSFIYTPWPEALEALKGRRADPGLAAYVERSLRAGVPEVMQGRPSMVLFRHVATSNYEISRFAIAADALPELQPLILEYAGDQFNNRNEWKYYLGRLRFQKGLDRHGQSIVEHLSVIDFTTSANRPLAELRTHWGESLVDFHHDLFHRKFPQLRGAAVDLSAWLKINGPRAKDYYKAFLTLFVRDAILFENFLLDAKELSFTREIVLPAILEIAAECGAKPLIVALEPTGAEDDQFWLSHPYDLKRHVEEKLRTGAGGAAG